MAEIKLSKQNFQNEVINSDIPVLVDFWATWCGPCRMIAPIISEIAEEANERFKVGKVNVDEESELASMFRIMSIPTLMVFKDGKPVNTVVGLRSKADLLAILN